MQGPALHELAVVEILQSFLAAFFPGYSLFFTALDSGVGDALGHQEPDGNYQAGSIHSMTISWAP